MAQANRAAGPPWVTARIENQGTLSLPRRRAIATSHFPGTGRNDRNWVRARLQTPLLGVISESSQVWGRGNTTAHSPWTGRGEMIRATGEMGFR